MKYLCNTAKAAAMALMSAFIPAEGNAQLSTNPDKFLGNITTSYQVDYGNEKFYTLWNQITPENETKWSSIEGSQRGSFNWGSDTSYNYAKRYGFPFKFHCLIWGAQYPDWLNSLSTAEQYKAIEEWMDAVKKKYPNLPMIDVVNEAVPGHQPAPYKAALGGDGKTGYDWIIKAFEMAYERWPNAILIYNDFNTFQWQRQEFINLVRTLRDAGAPIDAYGCQSHDLTDMNVSSFKSAMTEIQNALKMPMYSSEYDIGTDDDALQLQRYKEQIPYMWEADYCAGITLWGYIYGRTWTTDGNSGIIKDGKDRPAMTWLREYMQTDAAKNAKSPFPGMVKEASVYVKPSSMAVTKGEPMTVKVRAAMRTKTIAKVDLYVKKSSASNYELVKSMDSQPYIAAYTPETLGKYNLKAVVQTTDGTEYERLSSFSAYNPRSSYKGVIELPGTIQAENFDKGGEGVTYHDSDSKNEGTSYRTDGGGVDVVTGNGGYAIGYTASGEWLEYTVNVKEAGVYAYDITGSAGVTNASVSLSVVNDDRVDDLTGTVAIPCVQENNWDNYKTVRGRTLIPLTEGEQIIRLNIVGGSCNVDKVVFTKITTDPALKVKLSADPAPATINTPTTLIAQVTPGQNPVAGVKFYVEGALVKNVTEEPYETVYRPTKKGSYTVTAEAYDTEGNVSDVAKYTLKVNNKRTPYSAQPIAIPGIIQAERFDKGGEGLTFHDSDSKNEGDATRSDAEGVDLVKGNGGTVIGYTNTGEWLEYTINVKEAGRYAYEATVSSGTTGSGFRLSLQRDGQTKTVANVTVPQTASGNWDTYKAVKGNIVGDLEEGQYILRLTITGAQCNIDKLELKCTVPTGVDSPEAQSGNEGQGIGIHALPADPAVRGIQIIKGKKVYVR